MIEAAATEQFYATHIASPIASALSPRNEARHQSGMLYQSFIRIMDIREFRVAKVDNGYTVHIEGETEKGKWETRFFRTLICNNLDEVKKVVDEYLA